MIMHPVNWGVGVPGLGEIRGLPGIMGTDDALVSIGAPSWFQSVAQFIEWRLRRA